jgi:squalene-associated FAD-dependent desaturase
MTKAGSIGRALVVGAGMAGLSAAVRLARRGVRVKLVEAAMQAGGRCRSYHDPVLDMTIDNGNHFVVSGNRAVNDFLEVVGASLGLHGLGERGPAFHDLRDASTWTLWPNDSALPWWIFVPERRVPGTKPGDYLMLAPLLFPPKGKRIDEVIDCRGPLWDRLFGPFLLGALNTEPKSASADLAGAVIRKTFARGGHAYRPRIAHPTLASTFVDPALTYLHAHGAEVRLGHRVKELTMSGDRIESIAGAEGAETIDGDMAVILATPPWISQDLVPGLTVPNQFGAIVNAHFRIAPPEGAPPMLGVIGGSAEWVFAFSDRLSVTVSGADAMVDVDRQVLAERLWKDVSTVHKLAADLPPWQIVKERRATFLATPEQNARRPKARTPWRNLFLAGDWTATGLPATIEGAIQSGETAADLLLGSSQRLW